MSTKGDPLSRLQGWFQKKEQFKQKQHQSFVNNSTSLPNGSPTSEKETLRVIKSPTESIDWNPTPAVQQLLEWKEIFGENLNELQEELVTYLTKKHLSSDELAILVRNSVTELKLNVSDLITMMATLLKKYVQKSKKGLQVTNEYWHNVVTDLNNQMEHVTRIAASEEEKRRSIEKDLKSLRRRLSNKKLEVSTLKQPDEYEHLIKELEMDKPPQVAAELKSKPHTVSAKKENPAYSSPNTPKQRTNSPSATPSKKIKTPQQSNVNSPKSSTQKKETPPAKTAQKADASKPSVKSEPSTLSAKVKEPKPNVTNANPTTTDEKVDTPAVVPKLDLSTPKAIQRVELDEKPVTVEVKPEKVEAKVVENPVEKVVEKAVDPTLAPQSSDSSSSTIERTSSPAAKRTEELLKKLRSTKDLTQGLSIAASTDSSATSNTQLETAVVTESGSSARDRLKDRLSRLRSNDATASTPQTPERTVTPPQTSTPAPSDTSTAESSSATTLDDAAARRAALRERLRNRA